MLRSAGRGHAKPWSSVLGLALLAIVLFAPWRQSGVALHEQARSSRAMPSAPAHISGPPSATGSRQARFLWRAPAIPGRGFRCRLDNRSLAPCQSGITYRHLADGWHSFAVLAVKRDGHLIPGVGNVRFAPPSWRWRVLQPTSEVSLAGNVASQLYPGAAPSGLDLTIHNHSNHPVLVKHLTVSIKEVKAPKAGATTPCTSADFATSQYAGPAFIAPAGTSTLSRDGVPARRWPALQMLDLPVNQDGCAQAQLKLAYSATFSTNTLEKQRRAGTRKSGHRK